jgi:hypothetical protein
VLARALQETAGWGQRRSRAFNMAWVCVNTNVVVAAAVVLAVVAASCRRSAKHHLLQVVLTCSAVVPWPRACFA